MRSSTLLAGSAAAVVVALLGAPPRHAAAAMAPHPGVDDGGLEVVDLLTGTGTAAGESSESVAWSGVSRARLAGATVTVRAFVSTEGPAVVLVPHCNGRGKVTLDGHAEAAPAKGRALVPIATAGVHELRFEVAVSTYEKRVACGERIRVGPSTPQTEGLSSFATATGREAVVFVPYGFESRHDATKPGALLVGTHPWNGSPWTYAAYRELLDEAQKRDVLLLMPDGLGNSLYTADAEDEVMRAIERFSAMVPVDRRRISIWGASMGGAGATTISFHHPDRFAFVTSYFGDSKYDLTTYVRSLIPNEAAAKKVNALDVIENARHLPVWLVHGEDDKSSPVVQSSMLFDAMKKRGFDVTFDRVPHMGHEGPLVVKYIRRVVERAAEAKAPEHPSRVSFRPSRKIDREAYGVVITPRSDDAFVDLEKRADGIHVLPGTTGLTEIVLREGALGATRDERIHDDAGTKIPVRWANDAAGRDAR